MIQSPAGALSTRRRRSSGVARDERRAALLLLSPWAIGLVVFTIGPMAVSLYYAFTDYNLLSSPNWVGLGNFRRMADDPRFIQSVSVTLRYALLAVPLKLAMALGVALLLQKPIRWLATYRGAFYLPSLLGASVAVAILWRFVFGSDGLVNAVLGFFGIEGRSWIASPDTALWTLVLLAVWQFGAPMVIFLAALTQIPREYYEAAQIDGAGALRQFRSITLPQLSPIIFFNLVLQVITSFQTFTPSYVISGGTGGPSDTTLLYSLYLYMEAFTKFRMGYASAMAWVLLLAIGVVTAVLFATSRRWVFYADSGGTS